MSQFDELPEGWKWVELSDIAAIKSGLTKGKRRKDTDELKEIPYLRVANVQRGYLNLDEIKLIEATHLEIENFILRKGDILFTEGGDRDKLGRGWIWDEEILGCIHQNHIFRARLYDSDIDPRLISFYSNTHGQKYFLGEGRQTTNLASINLGKLSQLPIPLPPANEQRRIVEKIEALTARSRKAHAALDEIPALLDQFRQSVLAAAFRGDLTADWRAQNPNVEPAEVLLDRIKKTRLIKASTLKAKEKILEMYQTASIEDSGRLPENWQYFSLEKLCDSFQYGTSAKSLSKGDVPVLRMGNLQKGEIDWSDLAYSSDLQEIEKYKLNPGDVLFNRTNSPELVGKTSIYRGERAAVFAGYLIKIRNCPELNSEYLNFCLNTNYAKSYCWKVKSDGVSQSNINAQKLAKFEIPLCSQDEQREVVHQVKSLLSLANSIEEQYKEATSETDQLDQSILAKAFRGELVPQDPNDEPAAVLLDRIRAEREQLGSGKKRAKAKK